ncbi:MAG: GNAT family N-acetyltransferase [Planctomycetota bacterium]
MKVDIRRVERPEWLALAPQFTDYNYRQVWDFGTACAARVGAVCEHVAVILDGEAAALADVRMRRVPLLRTGIAYINGGPLVRRGAHDDADRFALAVQALVREYVQRRRCTLRILPLPGPEDWGAAVCRACAAAGLHPEDRLRPYRTLIVDVSRPPEQLRAALDRKWRYNLKRAEQEPLNIRSGLSPDLLDEFCLVFEAFAKRKHFALDLQPRFYAALQPGLPPCERYHVALADLGGRAVAGYVSSLLGDTGVSLLMATTEEALRMRAGYRLQWEAFRAAQQAGCRYYDMGGINPELNPGVYEFKKGVNGRDVCCPVFECSGGWVQRKSVAHAERLYRLSRAVRGTDWRSVARMPAALWNASVQRTRTMLARSSRPAEARSASQSECAEAAGDCPR